VIIGATLDTSGTVLDQDASMSKAPPRRDEHASRIRAVGHAYDMDKKHPEGTCCLGADSMRPDGGFSLDVFVHDEQP
jgi:hypothetical protein